MKRNRALGGAATALALLGLGVGPAAAQAAGPPKDVDIALIVPVSGPWAREGQLMRMGAEMATAEINAAGGIKSMGGAKMKLIVADAGATTETAKDAAQRVLAQNPDLAGGIGSWLSSFTLAVTEVTERAKLPWLTESYSDAITSRGYKYVFQNSPTANHMADDMIPAIIELAKTAGAKPLKTVGIVMDNTAANVSYVKPMLAGQFDKYGLKLVLDEVYTPPLSDATPLIEKVRSAHPDFLLLLSSNIPDDAMLLEKLDEFGLSVSKLPTIGSGTHMGTPELEKITGGKMLQGLLTGASDWGLNEQDGIAQRFEKRTGEPWITQDGIGAYGDMWIFKDALEKTGSTDRVKIDDVLHRIDIKSGPAAEAFPGPVEYDATGQRVDAPLVIVQWQNGKAVSVFPLKRALAKPFWP